MLRRVLIAASESDRLRRVTAELRPARRLVRRFVAGEDLAEAIAAARDLQGRGMATSIDHLGESVSDEAVARQAASMYERVLDRIEAADVDASISVKLTQLGIDVDEHLCSELLTRICEHAARIDRRVTVDMESSAYTQRTVDLVVALRAEGWNNLGCAVQAYLHRTPTDVDRLVASGASVRLCKGAYREPAEVALTSGREIDAAFVSLAERLLTSGTYPLIATHDHRILRQVRNLVRRHRLGRDDLEFQMLYGVREPLQRGLVDAGHRLCVYVPFGAEWYPYFMRRLAERPANLAFFLRAVIGRSGM